MKSPIFPKDETADDLHLDFSELLEEARSHSSDSLFSLVKLDSFEKAKMKEAKKKKKTWRRPMFSWFNSQKSARKSSKDVTSPTLAGNGSRLVHLQQKLSGPLISSCFTPTRAAESDEASYRYLGRRSSSGAHQAFGPIYMVT
ncbi:hypothetical protein Cni_G01988 [Canna indica]|uniref:Uncharacterized protein n=1 Tax=Canna indica TaxID=4628 RepID=A0AAQ3JNV7_9LILI|nr:hypothetical protein Cni_G01988 [Canna indica]